MTKTARGLRPEAYHTSHKHSLVPQDSIDLSSEHPKGEHSDGVASRLATSYQFRRVHSDATRAIADASCAPKMGWPLSLDAARAAPHFRLSLFRSRPQSPFGYSHNQAEKFAEFCADLRLRLRDRRAAFAVKRLLFSICYLQGLLLCAAKSPARPSGTTCHCGFNSSVQPFPVSVELEPSVGAGT